jgi:hypothetical protein
VSYGCGESQRRENNRLPPPLPFNGHQCDSLKARAYERLSTEGIEVIFNDTFCSSTWGDKRYYLDSIMRTRFNLRHTPVFNLNFSSCIQPTMDSAIKAKYGVRGKDSIINEAYRLTEIEYKKNR